MWNMRRKVNAAILPKNRRTVIQFIYPELPEAERNYWIIARPAFPIDMCMLDPGQDVDLYVTADLRAMTSAWMGFSTIQSEVNNGKINLIGNESLINSIGDWMVRSHYAGLKAA